MSEDEDCLYVANTLLSIIRERICLHIEEEYGNSNNLIIDCRYIKTDLDIINSTKEFINKLKERN